MPDKPVKFRRVKEEVAQKESTRCMPKGEVFSIGVAD
jgi:hypothetical protein|tara:strand:+ start:291 stop:401 length:111 start_codon:yes stop_codon:yes gene_type:complete